MISIPPAVRRDAARLETTRRFPMAFSIHCGIDLGSKQTQVAIIDDDQ